MKLRILVLNLRDITNPAAGGAEEHLHQLFSRLSAGGHEVTLHCGSYPGAARTEVVDSMRVRRRGGRITNAAWSVLFYLRHRKEFDVVVDYTCQLHFLTPLYCRLPRVAVALHIVGEVFTHDLPLQVGRLAAWWEAFSLRVFYEHESFIAISRSTADELQRHGIRDDQIRIVNGGRRDPAPPSGLPRSDVPTILYYGRLKRYKRPHLIIEALPEILKAIPSAKLEVVGSGDQLQDLRALADRLDVQSAITFHGWLEDSDRWRVVSSAWVNVLPSVKEGWPLSVMEAAQCGVPSVVTAAPGLRDVVLDDCTGLHFDPDQEGDLARRIVQILGDPSLQARFSAESKRWADSFSWDKASREVEETLLEITGNRIHPAAEPADAALA